MKFARMHVVPPYVFATVEAEKARVRSAREKQGMGAAIRLAQSLAAKTKS